MAILTLQPDATAGYDSLIFAQDATTNFGTNISLNVGETVSATELFRSLIKFDLSSIPSTANITSAVLNLWVSSSAGASSDLTINVFRVLRNWVEDQVTWNVYSTGNSWATAGCGNSTSDYNSTEISDKPVVSNSAAAGTKVTINLTPARVKEMIDGTLTNYGFLIKGQTETDNRISFRSSDNATAAERPQLIITYPSGGALFYSQI